MNWISFKDKSPDPAISKYIVLWASGVIELRQAWEPLVLDPARGGFMTHWVPMPTMPPANVLSETDKLRINNSELRSTIYKLEDEKKVLFETLARSREEVAHLKRDIRYYACYEGKCCYCKGNK